MAQLMYRRELALIRHRTLTQLLNLRTIKPRARRRRIMGKLRDAIVRDSLGHQCPRVQIRRTIESDVGAGLCQYAYVKLTIVEYCRCAVQLWRSQFSGLSIIARGSIAHGPWTRCGAGCVGSKCVQ